LLQLLPFCIHCVVLNNHINACLTASYVFVCALAEKTVQTVLFQVIEEEFVIRNIQLIPNTAAGCLPKEGWIIATLLYLPRNKINNYRQILLITSGQETEIVQSWQMKSDPCTVEACCFGCFFQNTPKLSLIQEKKL